MNEEHDHVDVTPPDILAGDELAQCKAQSAEYLNGWQRAKADFINYKNDEGKRLEDMARFMTRSLMQDIFPLLDSFDLAVKHFGDHKEANDAEEEKGILLIRSQLMDILKKRGLEVIAIMLGEPFNPEKHEALGEVESTFPSGSVVEEIQKGYMLQGKVVRPARVRVGK
ncbi:MAG: nucleotide exchange factor GrpE [Patescibacteria group bacterium]